MIPIEPASSREQFIVRSVMGEYGLGLNEIVGRLAGGLVNTCYLLKANGQKFVLKQLDLTITQLQIDLVVELLLFLEKRGFPISPRLVMNRRGNYVTASGGRLYFLQHFVPGTQAITMDNVTRLAGDKLSNFFRMVAEFSRAAEDFVPSGSYKGAGLASYPPRAAEVIDASIGRLVPDGRAVLHQHRDAIVAYATEVGDELNELRYDALAKQVVHFDIHPGNVHYIGDRVVGLFDYDMVGFDSRISDIAGALAMSCHDRRGGTLQQSKITASLSAYRKAYGKSEFNLKIEGVLLKAATRGCVLMQTLWATDWYSYNFERQSAGRVLQHWLNLCLGQDVRSLSFE